MPPVDSTQQDATQSHSLCLSTDFSPLVHSVWEKQRRREWGWWGNNMGVVIVYNLNISPKMSHGVLGCDTVMLQNYMLMILE